MYDNHNEYIKIFGDRIREKRISMDIKQHELAEMIGISNNCMGNIERGKSFPKIEHFIKLLLLLDVSFEEIVINREKYNIDISINEIIKTFDQLTLEH